MPSTAPEKHASSVHVAVAAIINNDEVLISLRPDHVHQGGLWEFPGGKVEQGESVEAALIRELKEEIGIEIEHTTPLIRISHNYLDKSVLLDVWRIHSFKGEAHGAEGQQVRWCKINQLNPSDFPQANRAIIKVLQFPDQLLITGNAVDTDDFNSRLEKALLKGIRLVQLRSKESSGDAFFSLVAHASSMCKTYDASLLLNTDLDVFMQMDADGLHLNSRRLFEYTERPVAKDKLLSVSCHNEQEIQQANRLNADIILLSPVNPTASHPEVPGLGWSRFMNLVAKSNCPVYALGGMELSDMKIAKQHGAQGIAAISSFWSYE